MTDLTQLSDKELSEAINFHRRQRNLSRGVNEAHHMRQTQMVRLLESEEARRLNEEKPNHYIVSKRKNGEYGVSQDVGNNVWDHSYHHGTHKTVDAAKAWAVKHAGKYPHKIEVKEEVEQIDEVSASTLRSYIDKSRADKKAAMKDRTAAEKNVKTYGMASDKKERDDASRRVGNRNQGISVANKKLGTYLADKAKAKVMAREEVEQIDEISTELKKRYVEKGADDVVDRFTGRGKYERPRNPAHFTKTGRVKKSALNRPEAIKYREKLDNRRDIVNKVSQEVHGKKRFGEEVEIDEANALGWSFKVTTKKHGPHDVTVSRSAAKSSDEAEQYIKKHPMYVKHKPTKIEYVNEGVELDEAESWEAGYKRRVVKTTSAEHKEKGYNWRIKGKERPEISIKLYKEKPSQEEFNKQMKRVAGHEFGG